MAEISSSFRMSYHRVLLFISLKIFPLKNIILEFRFHRQCVRQKKSAVSVSAGSIIQFCTVNAILLFYPDTLHIQLN